LVTPEIFVSVFGGIFSVSNGEQSHKTKRNTGPIARFWLKERLFDSSQG